MKRILRTTVVFLLLFLFAAQVQAKAPEWKVDTAHAGIYFGIEHIFSTTRGYFKDFKGTVLFSPDDLGGSQFDFEVTVKSIDTANSKRDGHLNSGDFFDSKKYPTMTFESTAVKPVQDNQYLVEGWMTIKDVKKAVSVPFTFEGPKPHPFNKTSEVAGFEARMTIDRLVYHVGSGKYYDMGVLDKDVEVLISFEATRKK